MICPPCADARHTQCEHPVTCPCGHRLRPAPEYTVVGATDCEPRTITALDLHSVDLAPHGLPGSKAEVIDADGRLDQSTLPATTVILFGGLADAEWWEAYSRETGLVRNSLGPGYYSAHEADRTLYLVGYLSAYTRMPPPNTIVLAPNWAIKENEQTIEVIETWIADCIAAGVSVLRCTGTGAIEATNYKEW